MAIGSAKVATTYYPLENNSGVCREDLKGRKGPLTEMKHATSELPGYLSNCCRSHFHGQITSKQSADKFSHLAPCRVPMSFSKDWQIAWPVRISAFTMGWFSLLPWLTNIIPAFKHSLWFSMFCNKLSDPEMYWLLKCTISRQSTSLLYFHYP